jgi:hypothetical protein
MVIEENSITIHKSAFQDGAFNILVHKYTTNTDENTCNNMPLRA